MYKRLPLLFCFVLFALQTTLGQIKTISVPTYPDGDTSLWFNWQQEKFLKSGLPDLVKSTDRTHFRFSTETQAVDIWTKDFITFYGTLANYTTRYDPDKYKQEKPKPEKFQSSISEIDTAVAKQIFLVLESLAIFSIPTSDSIVGWESGMDGTEILIEYSTPHTYSFKEYWTPSHFKTELWQAAAIDSLENQLNTTLEMRKAFGVFINSLPHGCYRAGSFFVTCTIKSDKKSKKRKGRH